ncbi:MAG: hypothetical protein AB7K71_07000 [Polyangiaceae bacterium]
MTKRIGALIGLALAASGCGSDGAGSDNGGGFDLSGFAGYCSGTLLVDHDVQIASGAGRWTGTSADDFFAPAGTEFLVSPSFDKWGGYVVYKDGTAGRVDDDFSTGLIKDQDFTSDCAIDVNTYGVDVLMQDSSLYETQALSGTRCVLPAGTVLEQLSFVNSSDAASVSAEAIRTQCGWDTAYSKDIAYGELLPL